MSGKNAVRLGLEQCREALRSGDTLAVWRLERSGVGLEGLTDKIETNSAAGKLVFHVFAALAEFEPSLIRERTHAGLAAARARGRSGGWKPKLEEKQVREIRALLRVPDIQLTDVARRYGVSSTTLDRHVGVIKPQRKNKLIETGTIL